MTLLAPHGLRVHFGPPARIARVLLRGFDQRIAETGVAGPLVLLRLSDVLLALPSVLLAIAVVAVLGPGVLDTVLAVAMSSLPAYVRLVRASALGELARPYVLSSRAIGAGAPRLLFRIVLPNCLEPMVVAATLDFSSAILTTAGLGLLGLGAQPPAAEWGTLLSGARDLVGRAYWVTLVPGRAILTVVLCVNIVGDALRDALDPRRGSGSRSSFGPSERRWPLGSSLQLSPPDCT